MELDKAMEELTTTSQKLEEKEKALSGAELEVSALNRRVQVDFELLRISPSGIVFSILREISRFARTNCSWPHKSWIRFAFFNSLRRQNMSV